MSAISPTSSTTSTSTSTTSSSGSGPITFNGIISGLNTTAIINALMQAYEQPQIDIGNQIQTLQANLSDYQQISADMTGLQSAADSLTQTSQWSVMGATTSNSAVATATAGAGASPSTIAFNVNQLAQSNVITGANSVSSTTSTVASSNFLLSSQASGFGISSLAGSSLTVGTHAFSVSTALSGGVATGSAYLPSSVTIGSSNDTVNATVNGTAYTFTIASGTYTQAQLSQAVASASVVSGTQLLQSRVNSDGQLVVGTSLLGSSASLQLTGGTALSTLGLAAQSTASVGTAGSITLDGTATAVNNVQAGSTVSLADGSGGTITAGIGSFGIKKGSFNAMEVAAGNGSLQDVVNNINNSGAGVTATAVQVSSTQYILQLSSNTTGTDGAITVESAPFATALGSFNTVAAAQNSQINVGGSGGYVLSGQTNAISGVLPGVTINLVSAQAPGSSPIDLTVSPDGQSMAKQVQSLVTAANQALTDINKYAGYNYKTNTGGPLMGDSTLSQLTNQVLGIVSNAIGQGNFTPAQAGLSVTSGGLLQFDPTTFAQAYDANPSQVASLFNQSGSFTPSSSTYSGTVSLVYASDGTAAGAYPITITHSATQAQDAGNVLSTGTITNAETITVTMNGASASYAAAAGESLTSIAQGLNAAFVASGIGVAATVVTSSGGSQLVLTSNQYGSAQSFSVDSTAAGSGQTGLVTTANTPQSFTGTDVAGTINGVTATGSGQVLSAPTSDPTLAGLAVQVTATGITSATNIGTFNYQQGIAGGLAYASNGAAAPVTGSLTTTVSGIQGQIASLQQQYASYTPMIQAEQAMLEQEFSTMESQLGALQNQGQWLAGQIKQLP